MLTIIKILIIYIFLFLTINTIANTASVEHNENISFIGNYNKYIFNFNLKFHEYIGEPIINTYNLTPFFLRDRIEDYFNTLIKPISFVGNLLQLEPKHAIDDLTSFTINIVLGFGGWIDLGKNMNLSNEKENFSQTFYKYGWQKSTVIVLPIFGFSSIRDLTGLFFDSNIKYKYNQLLKYNQSPTNVYLGKSFISYSKNAKYFNQLEIIQNKYIFSKEIYLQDIKNRSLEIPITEQTNDFNFD